MAYALTHWNMGAFYQTARELTWKHKKLWILGVAVAVTTGGGSFNSNFQNNFSGSDSSSGESGEVIEEKVVAKGKLPFAAENFDPESSFGKVQPAVYVILGAEVLTFFVAMILISLMMNAWSRASLIHGAHQVISKDAVDLKVASTTAGSRVKDMILLSLVPMLKLTLLLVGLMFGVAITFVFSNYLGVIAGLVAILYWIYRLALLATSLIWAERILVTDGVSWKEALAGGQVFAKGNILKVLALGLLNTIVRGIVMFVIFLPLGGSLVSAFVLNSGFSATNFELNWAAFIPVIVLALPTLLAAAVVSVGVTVFTYFVWQLALNALVADAAAQKKNV